jgi:hypothetical protein
LKAAGFEAVEVESWRVYQVDDTRGFLAESGIDVDRLAPQIDGKVASAFIRARRPDVQPLLRTDLLLMTSRPSRTLPFERAHSSTT